MECPLAALNSSHVRIRQGSKCIGTVNRMDRYISVWDFHSMKMSSVTETLWCGMSRCIQATDASTLFICSFKYLLCIYNVFCKVSNTGDTALNVLTHLNKMPDINAMKKIKPSNMTELLDRELLLIIWSGKFSLRCWHLSKTGNNMELATRVYYIKIKNGIPPKHSKENNQQNKKAAYWMGEDICKWQYRVNIQKKK